MGDAPADMTVGYLIWRQQQFCDKGQNERR